MQLKHSMDYYNSDQGIQRGDIVISWNAVFDDRFMLLRKYGGFETSPDGQNHTVEGIKFKHVVKVAEPVELEAGQPTPDPVKVENSYYGDVWVKAYASAPADNAVVADAALSDYKTREANGDFKK